MSEELVNVLRRCEQQLKAQIFKSAPVTETERLELWRDVSVQLELAQRAEQERRGRVVGAIAAGGR